ncbi:RND family transporter [Gemmatimonadota bacterium]
MVSDPLNNRFFDRLAAFTVNRSRWIIASIILISISSLVLLTRLELSSDLVSIMLRNYSEAEDFLLLRERYQSAEPIIIMVSLPEDDSFQNPERLSQLIGYRDDLSHIPLVAEVACFIPKSIPGLQLDLTADTISRVPAIIRNRLFENPLSDVLLSSNQQHTLLIVVPEMDDVPQELIDNLYSLPPPPDMDRVIAGNPIVFATIKQISTGIILFIPPLVILLSIIAFFFVIGDLRLSIIAVFPAIIASIWQMALLVVSGIEVTVWTVIAPVFVTVLGSADGLHFVTHYQKIYNSELSRSELITRILNRVGVPIILTTISTSAGFFSLLATGIHSTQQLGGSTAVGILLAGMVSLIGLPAIISLLPARSEQRSGFLAARALVSRLQIWAGNRSVAIVFSASILLIGIITIPRLESQAGPLFYFRNNAEIRVSFARIDEIFGGSTSLVGEFVRETNSTLESELREMSDLSREMEQLPGIRKVLSLADLRPYLSQSALEQSLEGGEIPGFGQLASRTGIKFLAFLENFTDNDILEWQEFAKKNDLIRSLTGTPLLFDSLNHTVVRAQKRSLSLAFVLIWITLLLMYRRLRRSLLALIPIITSTVALLSFLSLCGTHLNVSNAVMASIVIGIGVDYAIHFLAAVNHHQGDGPGYATRAIGDAGLPIIANAIGIAIGFSTLYLSPLRPHVHIASIMWVTMLIAAFSALVVIPALFPKTAFTGESEDTGHGV